MKTLKKLLTSKTFYLSIGGLISAGVIFVLLMDFVIMPKYTNYNEGVTIPDVTKLSLEEAESLLTDYGLRFEVHDRRAHSAYPANYVIDQSPSPRQLVKPNRKVYLTVNTESTPQVEVPNVVNLSYRNARLQLENSGLTIGSTSYESNRFKNTILRQSVAPGDTVDRGTAINLVVSDGLGARIVDVPQLEGLRLTEAQQQIMRAGLRVGPIRFEPSRDVTPNTVLSFSPNVAELQEGETIELVVAERFDAREESETGAIIDDTTSSTPPDTSQIDNSEN
ncbi:PASTA domain-containing protein [Rhodohalobacter halophilus]|uniref:PASTA domain-containing protein n=1 Tax=Rhodohalobacter halophilus TaxID=1812810 RepID=UPI00083F79A8|nr:PASTA domain-containing protein [Rhodohalobacter halophilus]